MLNIPIFIYHIFHQAISWRNFSLGAPYRMHGRKGSKEVKGKVLKIKLNTGVSKNKGFSPKMDGLLNGKPY